MWTVIKFDKKNLALLKKDFSIKLGKDVEFYSPKIQLKRFLKKKILVREISLLNDYLLCFHKDFCRRSVLNSLKYCRGLKYFLSDFLSSQKEIENFIYKCKKNENKNGNHEFIPGPFTNFIFSIFKENKLSIYGIMGNYNITVSKNSNYFRNV